MEIAVWPVLEEGGFCLPDIVVYSCCSAISQPVALVSNVVYNFAVAVKAYIDGTPPVIISAPQGVIINFEILGGVYMNGVILGAVDYIVSYDPPPVLIGSITITGIGRRTAAVAEGDGYIVIFKVIILNNRILGVAFCENTPTDIGWIITLSGRIRSS